MLGKKGLHLNRNCLKQFAKNLINAIRELWKLEKPFRDLTQNGTNKLIKNQISGDSRIRSLGDNNISHNSNDVNSNLDIFTKSEKSEIQSKHINRKDSNLDFHDLVKLRKDYERNPTVGDYIS